MIEPLMIEPLMIEPLMESSKIVKMSQKRCPGSSIERFASSSPSKQIIISIHNTCLLFRNTEANINSYLLVTHEVDLLQRVYYV